MNIFPADSPVIGSAKIGEGLIILDLIDGRTVVARYDGFPLLQSATSIQIKNWEIIGGGSAIYWPEIDEGLSVDGLLRDAVAVIDATLDATG